MERVCVWHTINNNNIIFNAGKGELGRRREEEKRRRERERAVVELKFFRCFSSEVFQGLF